MRCAAFAGRRVFAGRVCAGVYQCGRYAAPGRGPGGTVAPHAVLHAGDAGAGHDGARRRRDGRRPAGERHAHCRFWRGRQPKRHLAGKLGRHNAVFVAGGGGCRSQRKRGANWRAGILPAARPGQHLPSAGKHHLGPEQKLPPAHAERCDGRVCCARQAAGPLLVHGGGRPGRVCPGHCAADKAHDAPAGRAVRRLAAHCARRLQRPRRSGHAGRDRQRGRKLQRHGRGGAEKCGCAGA